MAGHPLCAFPLTYEQEAMWLHDHLDPEPSMYLESWACRLRGTVDTSAVEWAVAEIVARHPALHSGIEFDAGRLVQTARNDHATVVERLGRPDRALMDALEEMVWRPLDIRASPLRATLLELSPEDVVLVIQFHHMVVDDWALAVLEKEFQELYSARVTGRAARLAPLLLQPGEYAATQRAAGIDASVAAYWQECLRDAPMESTIPPDHEPPDRLSRRGGLVQFQIDAALGNGLRAMARRSRTTPFTLLAAAASVLLYAYNDSSDQVLGTVVSRRGSAGLDQMITCLADLMPLRQRLLVEGPFSALVTSTKQAVTGTLAHRDIPFSMLLKELGWPRNFSRPPLCQVALVVDDVPRCPLQLPGVESERLHVHSGFSKFDVSITLVKDGDCYQSFLVYASDLFRPETARQIVADFCTLLAVVIARPDEALADVVAGVVANR